MKVFVSYSINDSEQYVLTLLAQHLKEQDAYIDSSYNDFDNVLDYNTFSKITKSHLFIGIITHTGEENDRVLKEWDLANSKNIPSILLVDDSINLPSVSNHENVITFNRNNPEEAITLVRNKTGNKQILTKNDSNKSNSAAWVLGGLAILAIIYLLSNSNKK